jgi:hypothetical protein
MGADIHMYVEYRDKKHTKKAAKADKKSPWFSYGDEINPGRNYIMFGILAGVRGSYKGSFDPKGQVDDMGYAAKDNAYMFIVDEPREKRIRDNYVSREDALRYVSYGRKIIDDKWVEHPDWHSHSWLTIKELEKAFKLYEKYASKEWGEPIKVGIEYRALLASMKALEDDGNNEVRVVFWFDN